MDLSWPFERANIQWFSHNPKCLAQTNWMRCSVLSQRAISASFADAQQSQVLRRREPKSFYSEPLSRTHQQYHVRTECALNSGLLSTIVIEAIWKNQLSFLDLDSWDRDREGTFLPKENASSRRLFLRVFAFQNSNIWQHFLFKRILEYSRVFQTVQRRNTSNSGQFGICVRYLRGMHFIRLLMISPVCRGRQPEEVRIGVHAE